VRALAHTKAAIARAVATTRFSHKNPT
jgi:hypothetical protein